MAWETVVLKVADLNKLSRTHRHDWLCPKCERQFFTIPYKTQKAAGAPSQDSLEDEKEFRVLICDRCGQFIAFEGCTGECATSRKPKCEICGRYYCQRCGIMDDMDVDGKKVELRYCNDHIPEWYKNR